MNASHPIGIIGAGPAGATLARLLARKGLDAILIDSREPHEKACGGGVTLRGYRGRPLLEEALGSPTEVRKAVVESDGARVEVSLPHPVRMYARRDLNRLLFEAALGAGARFVRARARGLTRGPRGFRIDLEGAAPLEVSFVAGADGAAGVARKLLGGGRGRGRFVLAMGFHAPRRGEEEPLYINFPPGLAGYVWIFPRSDHSSVGICSRDRRVPPGTLRRLLRATLESAGLAPAAMPGSHYAFPIPDFNAFDGPRSGERWALIGDAGGFVDPITLEGISYAIRSAELLAAAVLAGRPGQFEASWRADFGAEIARAAGIVDRFYRGDFTARMVRAAASHPRIRSLLGGLLSGGLPYRGLRARVVRAILADRSSALFRRLVGSRA